MSQMNTNQSLSISSLHLSPLQSALRIHRYSHHSESLLSQCPCGTLHSRMLHLTEINRPVLNCFSPSPNCRLNRFRPTRHKNQTFRLLGSQKTRHPFSRPLQLFPRLPPLPMSTPRGSLDPHQISQHLLLYRRKHKSSGSMIQIDPLRTH